MLASLLCWVGAVGVADASQHVLTLHRGDTVLVEVLDADGQHVTVRHPVFGEVAVPLDDIASLQQAPQQAPQQVASASPASEPAGGVSQISARPGAATAPPAVDRAGRSPEAGRPQEPPPPPAAPAAAPAPAPAPEPEPEAVPWKGRLGAAFTGSQTTQTTYNLRLSGRLYRTAPESRTDLSVSYYLNSADGNITDNDLLARGEQNWLNPESEWEVFVQSTYQYDQFEAWAHRLSPYGGLGLQLVQEDDFMLNVKGGGGVTWEQGAGLVRPQALFEVEVNWKIDELQSLAGYSSIAPDVENPADFLATIKWDWRLRLGKESPLALNIGVREIYDSTPGSGANHSDFKLWAGVTWDF
ncbi:MAG: DUF481 domain-containing protein [Phycisphaerales bacterium]|nr:DUF481 domain-containing protein [Phycisphaerales bacterium]